MPRRTAITLSDDPWTRRSAALRGLTQGHIPYLVPAAASRSCEKGSSIGLATAPVTAPSRELNELHLPAQVSQHRRASVVSDLEGRTKSREIRGIITR